MNCVINDLRTSQGSSVTTAHFCIICLDTDCKLYPLRKYSLGEAYENLTGKSLQCKKNFTPEFCTECAQRLVNCTKFRDKSLRSYYLLSELFENNDLVTTHNLKTINRSNNQLTSNIEKKIFKPDHCDLYLIDNKHEVKIEHKIVEIEPVLNSVDNIDTVAFEPKAEVFNDIKSDEEFLNDDIDNDTDFLYCDSKVKSIKSDADNVEAFTNDGYDNVDLLNDTDNDWDFLKDSDSEVEIVNEASKKEDIKIDKVTSKTTKRKASSKKEKPPPKPRSTVQKDPKKKVRVRAKNEAKKPSKRENLDYLKQFLVTKLSHEEQLADIQKRKESDNFKNSPFKCMKCFKGFCNVTTYDTHMEKHTNKFGPFECNVCGIHIKNNYRLRHHVIKNHSMRYSCYSCPLVTNHKESAQNHERWHKGTKFKCPHCNEEYSKKTSYLSHIRIWHPSDVVCTLCGFSFINERGLRMHVNLKHRFDNVQNPDGPLCEPCDIRFASDTAYKQHLNVSPKHADGDSLKRNTPQRLRDHRNQPSNYKSVQKPKVETEVVECEQCGTQFKGFKLYAYHFKRFHPDKKRTQYPAHSPQRFLCEQCGRSFKHRCALRDHMLTHSGKKEFQCDICKKKYYLRTNLITHLKSHNEVQPTYECPICGKHFTNKANTNRHIWTHKDLKPFKCHACDKTYVNASARRSHVLHAHLKQPWPKKSRGPRVRASRARHTKEAVCGTIWPKSERALAIVEDFQN